MIEHMGCLYVWGGYNGSQWLNDFHGFDIGELPFLQFLMIFARPLL